MSYLILKSFSFSGDLRSVRGKYYSSNISPKTPFDYHFAARDDENTFDFVRKIIVNIIDGNLQFRNSERRHIIDLIDYMVLCVYDLKGRVDLWSPHYYDYGGEYSREVDKVIFSSKEKEETYEKAEIERNRIIDEITTAFMNKKYKQEIRGWKEPRFYLQKREGNHKDWFIRRLLKSKWVLTPIKEKAMLFSQRDIDLFIWIEDYIVCE